jgi:hypothetical protein
VLDGLPINQYREAEVSIGPTASEVKPVNKDAWPEHPMPRDSHLLPEHSQQLLRAARAGRLLKPPAPPEEDRENMDEEEEVHKEVQHGFTVKKWVKVARHLEEPEPEYLAKRRKGLPSQYAVVNGATQPTPLRETKVRKLDSEGNVSVYKVLVPEGQTVQGEVLATEAVPLETAPVVPGTVVEGVGIVNADGIVVVNDIAHQTPPRRGPPRPKKKVKKGGPGRGKKKVVFAEGSAEHGASTAATDLLAVPGMTTEGTSGDTPMGDAGDEEEGDEESDEEDGEDRETPGRSVTPSKAPAEIRIEHVSSTSASTPVEEIAKQPTPPALSDNQPRDTREPPMPEGLAPVLESAATAGLAKPQYTVDDKARLNEDASSSPELALSAISHSRQNSLTQVPTLSALTSSGPVPAPVAPGAAHPAAAIPEASALDVPPHSLLPETAPTQPPSQQILLEVPTSGSDAEPNLLRSLELHLDQEERFMSGT